MIESIRRLIQPKRPYLAHVEYWVYLPETKLPPQDILLGRLLRSSPFRVGEEPAVGPQEALLFSDIRLHTALCLRSKNPHLFRPDLFSDHVEPSEDSLRSLSSAQAIAKLRFVSEEPLQGRRHLRFLPHLAEAVAYYGKAETLFDVQAERLAGLESFRAQLDCDPEAEGHGFHARSAWCQEETGGRAVTRGLRKVGLPEIETPLCDREVRSVLTNLLDAAIEQVWSYESLPDELEVSHFGDEYLLKLAHGKSTSTCRVLRKDPV